MKTVDLFLWKRQKNIENNKGNEGRKRETLSN